MFAVEDYESEMTYGDAFSLGMFMISGGAAYMGDMKSEMGQSARAFEYIQGAADVADEIGIGSFGMKPIISGTAVRLVEGHFWDE